MKSPFLEKFIIISNMSSLLFHKLKAQAVIVLVTSTLLVSLSFQLLVDDYTWPLLRLLASFNYRDFWFGWKEKKTQA